jgi:hypothetical protein
MRNTVFRDLNISAIYRSSLSVTKAWFAFVSQRDPSTRYEKVGPRLGFAVVPEKVDAGLDPPLGIKVEVFVICNQKV